MFTVTYLNKHSKTTEIAGYAETLLKAKRLAKVFASEPRLVDSAQDVIIWAGQAGGMRAE